MRRIFTCLSCVLGVVAWLVAGVALPVPGAQDVLVEEAAASVPCPDPEYVPGQGPSCEVDLGWEVLLDNGKRLLTHGPDKWPSSPQGPIPNASANSVPSDPVCVSSGEYHVHVVYAVPTGKTNRHATMLTTIREIVRDLNGKLNEAALVTGTTPVNLRVRCDVAGTITVANATLPTPAGSDNFSTITNDLSNLGYNSTFAKYLVLYDDPVCDPACYGGQGSIHDDDRLVADNANNFGPDYGISYDAFFGGVGSINSHVPFHELSHNIGAVQMTAPHTSSAWHCNDGWDVMCYADGGATQCTGDCVNTCFDYQRYDCGNNDYFHTNPPAGNYLATHWNLGNPLNRFYQFGTASTASWQQEAEAFASRPVGGQCTSASASGGLCWNIWTNGTISTTTSSLTAQTKRVTVRALGDPAGGVWPQMKVRVDGVQVMDVGVTADTWQSYSAAITLSAGVHTVEVQYTNDGSVDGNDRNLLVDYASIGPATRTWFQEAETFTTRTAGGLTPSSGASGGAYWNLWSNGYIEHAMSVPYTSQHEIEVRARGDVAGGVWPIMKVYVDGTLVLTQTVNVTSWTSYPIRRVLTGGSHTLRIEFTNDAMVNGQDRNLKLDYGALHS